MRQGDGSSVLTKRTPGTKDKRTVPCPLDFGPVSFTINDPNPGYPSIDGLEEVQVIGPANANVELYDEDPGIATETYIRGLSLVAAVKNGEATYYHYNAHGDVVQLTNSSGSITRNYAYDAFGVEKDPSLADANLFRYCGEQYDKETGNYYLRARYYDPTVGRFTQEDTVPYVSTKHPNGQSIIDPLSLNLYTYCYNNPLSYRDPSGNTALAETWQANMAPMANWDGPYPWFDLIFAFGTGVAYVIDGALLLWEGFPADTNTQQGGSASAGSGAGRTSIGSGEAASGGPNNNKNNKKNDRNSNGSIKRVTEYLLDKYGLDAHAIKREFLGEKTKVKLYDLVYNTTSKQVLIILKKTGEVVAETYYFLK